MTQASTAQAPAIEHHATSTGTDNRKLLWWIFLGSECLFFGSLLTTYLIFKGSLAIPPFPTDRIVDAAALVGISDAAREACHSIGNNLFQCDGILDVPVTSQSTFVLLMSSVTMVLAVYSAQNNHLKTMKLWLFATVLLGLAFLGYQVFEFTTFGNEGLNLGSNQFGASFFMLTGFHGTHVAVGVLYLGSLLLASFRRSGLGPEAGFHIETAGLYWHFVDIVWIVLFTVIYLIPA